METFFNHNYRELVCSPESGNRISKVTFRSLSMMLGLLLLSSFTSAEDQDTHQVLFENIDIFDGNSDTLLTNHYVLIEGELIKSISDTPISVKKNVEVIDGRGHTLMPGLIDAHWHAFMAAHRIIGLSAVNFEDVNYMHMVAASEAENTLMRGVTTVRDVGGPVFGLKRAIDEGLLHGPRIYPSGAIISQTSGHGDWRIARESHRRISGKPSLSEIAGVTAIADGVPEVLAAAREQLRHGAVHIKLTAGGGLSTKHDPIDSTQYTIAELQAAVDAASDWGTYVTVHAYTPYSIQRAISAGVKVIEHGHLLDEETIKLMVKKGVWLSIQTLSCFDEEPADRPVCEGAKRVFELMRKYKNLKVGWGSDTFAQAKGLVTIKSLLTPVEILRLATGNNGKLMELTGPRNPYPHKLGIVAEGAYADLLLVKGNPLDDIDLIADTENLMVIMKSGRFYKNTL